MSPNRAARRSRGKRAWRRAALSAADRAVQLDRRGFPAETIAKRLRLSPELVRMMLAAVGAAPGEQEQGAKAS